MRTRAACMLVCSACLRAFVRVCVHVRAVRARCRFCRLLRSMMRVQTRANQNTCQCAVSNLLMSALLREQAGKEFRLLDTMSNVQCLAFVLI